MEGGEGLAAVPVAWVTATFQAIEHSDYNGWVGAEYKSSTYTEDTLRWKQWIASNLVICN